MFTGIVEETGEVLEFVQGEQGWRMRVRAEQVLEGLALGDSIAVNGCCLTAVDFDAQGVSFDVLAETVRATSFDGLQAGARVNLERSLRFDGKVGGHFVSGHVDAPGEIVTLEARGDDYYLAVRAPERFMRYLIYKGSIAIDGISLTVAEVDDAAGTFSVWIIPHTLEVTNLGQYKAGDRVNLEFDMLAKYVERLTAGRGAP